jgi:hypothetical protein
MSFSDLKYYPALFLRFYRIIIDIIDWIVKIYFAFCYLIFELVGFPAAGSLDISYRQYIIIINERC